MKVAVIGATGLVGTRMLEVLSQRNFPAREVLVAASREWAPRFAAAGCRVVDNSSCWRMDPTKKLVVPEINGDVLTAEDFIIAVSVTTVRVPVRGGHSEAVNIELEKPFELARVREILSATSGVTLLPEGQYPVPKDCEGKDDVFVGRLRRDTSLPSALNLWCVSDNLRKGAATNAVQIAELLLRFCQK